MEYTPPPKPQLSSRANAFSIAALMSSGSSKDKEAAESTIKPLGESGWTGGERRWAAGRWVNGTRPTLRPGSAFPRLPAQNRSAKAASVFFRRFRERLLGA